MIGVRDGQCGVRHRAAFSGLILSLTFAGCGAGQTTIEPETVRIVMGGDVMLGRAIGALVQRDPHSILAGVEMELASADLAMVNLESPLTTRPAVEDIQYDLRADPAAAETLSGVGIDLVSVANNHAGDAGPMTVLDTVGALTDAGIGAVGGGTDSDDALAAAARTIGTTSIGVLAFDATGLGPEADDDSPGVARWDDVASPVLVAHMRERVDVLVVSIHGGAEYLVTSDATIRGIVSKLAELDVDVVWGHGPHVVHDVSVIDPDGNGRVTVAASSLGNLVFDQSRLGTDRGMLFEVMASNVGVVAYRIGDTEIAGGRVSFTGWQLPDGPAALLAGDWWGLTDVSPPTAPSPTERDLSGFEQGDVVFAAEGDVDRDGDSELVVSFWRPFRAAPLNQLLAHVRWTDAAGRSAHLGVFEPSDLSPVWVASAMVRPIAEIVVCDGSIAVTYTSLDDDAATGTGAWEWNGFGWDEASDLRGLRTMGCRDVDGGGAEDPVVGPSTTDEP